MARTSEASREDVRLIYQALRAAKGGVTAAEVYKELFRVNGRRRVRGLRAVEGDVRFFKDEEKEHGYTYESTSWNKWYSEAVPSVHMPQVLRINAVSQELLRRPLSEIEAEWAGRVCSSVDGLDLVAQWFLVWVYTVRDVSRQAAAQSEAGTFHLDQLLAFRPWVEANRGPWELWKHSPFGVNGGFLSLLESLREHPLPPPLDQTLSGWATTQLIGPWNQRTDEWSWERILREHYGSKADEEANNAET